MSGTARWKKVPMESESEATIEETSPQGGAGGRDLAAHEAVDVEGGAQANEGAEVGQHRVPDGVDAEQGEQAQGERPDVGGEAVLDARVERGAEERRNDRLDDVGDDGGRAGDGDGRGGAPQQPGENGAGGVRGRRGQRRVRHGQKSHDPPSLSVALSSTPALPSERDRAISTARPGAGSGGGCTVGDILHRRLR